MKGQALAVTTTLPPDTTWEKLLQALKIKYQEKAPYDVLMAQFYGTKMEPDENCASFGTRLEQKFANSFFSNYARCFLPVFLFQSLRWFGEWL